MWLQHGFARGPRHLAGLAGALRAVGLEVTCPALASLRPRRSLHDRDHLISLGRALRRAGTGPLVGIGHSAGAAAVFAAAGVLDAVVCLDPVDTVGGVMAGTQAEVLDLGVPVIVVALRPSRCNRHGQTVRTLTELIDSGRLHGWTRRYPDLGHADPERIPADLTVRSVPPESRWVRLACGAAGPPSGVVALGRDVVADTVRLLERV